MFVNELITMETYTSFNHSKKQIILSLLTAAFIKQLQRDTDLRNAQIADLQQKILDSDQGKTSASLII